MNQGRAGQPDDDTAGRRLELVALAAEGVGVDRDHLAAAYGVPEGDLEVEDTSRVGPEPGTLLDLEAQGRRLAVTARKHAEMAEHAQHTGDAQVDPAALEHPGAPGLVDDRRYTGLHCGPAQGAGRTPAVDDQGTAEGGGELGDPGMAQIGPDVGEIRPVSTGGVEVDAVVAPAHDVLEDLVGEAGGE